MSYQGVYRVKNIKKYEGDPTRVIFRSLWERNVFRFMDENDAITSWNSEEIIVPYVCETDGRAHRYFVDIKCTLRDGRTFLIEIKPKKETIPPAVPKRKTRRFLTEALTFVKNQSKWRAADEYAKDHGWEFCVWTEDHLKSLGIRIITPRRG